MEVTGVLDEIHFGKVGGTQPDWNSLVVPQNVKQKLGYDLVIILSDTREN